MLVVLALFVLHYLDCCIQGGVSSPPHKSSNKQKQFDTIFSSLYVIDNSALLCMCIVLSKRVDRAHTKLQKWDQMACKITELSEQKQQKAREKEMKLQKRLEHAQKVKEEQIKYQKDQTLFRLKNWQERRDKFSQTVLIKDKKRMNLSNKLEKEKNDDIEKRRTM